MVVLDSIIAQDYPDIEVIISDDCSSDDSFEIIPKYISEKKASCQVRFQYIRQVKNLGYDGNLRASMVPANGDYIFILGNDDALPQINTISKLVSILKRLEYPHIAFANFHLYGKEHEVVSRAQKTALIGAGPDVAVRTFRSFSFVAGIVVKRSAFQSHDCDSYDGSIYFQIYMAARIIASGGSLASIAEPMVAKDVEVGERPSNSYLDVLASDNRKLTPKTGGLDQVGRVACDAILPYVPANQRSKYIIIIYRQILMYSYSYWLYDYRQNNVYRAAVNLAIGCYPSNLIKIQSVPLSAHVYIFFIYLFTTLSGLLVPVNILSKMKSFVFRMSKTI